MAAKRIVIWGAGRIGRGFIGDIFNKGNYEIVFVDDSRELVHALKETGKFRVVRAFSEDNIQEEDITGYSVLHTSQKKEIQQALNESNLMALSVFPQSFEAVAAQLQEHLLRRLDHTNEAIDVLLCTNLIHAGPKFSAFLLQGINPDQKEALRKQVGIVETLVIRICPEPPTDIKKDHPLVVWTNGYPQLPVDKHGFMGRKPDLKSLRFVEDMRAEEIRKIYTYNMCHAVLSFHGHMAGYALLVDCLRDGWIRNEAEGALGEISEALQKQYGFSPEEMRTWVTGVINQTDNVTIGDTVKRSAANPIRKLQKDDRLIGPALLCISNRIKPVHIIRAAAAALHYRDDNDQESLKLNDAIRKSGVRQAVAELCGLGGEDKELVDLLVDQYNRLPDEIKWNQIAEKAYNLGFQYEKIYHGCGQCVIAAATEALGIFDDELFNSATGLCGGLGLVNETTCSALTGGAMVIGLLYPRRRENFDGDRSNKYVNFELVQKLRERFLEKYGTITCGQIHKELFGRPFDLRSKEEREKFEAVGGHGDHGCTEVVADAAKWTIEIIANQKGKEREDS